MQRIRIQYAKVEGLRYTGNLDMHRVWERSLRRARLPVAYSQGFHPQPKIQQGYPLPLGYLSDAEVVDVWLDQEQVDPEGIRAALQPAIPGGIEIQSVQVVDLRETPLQARARSAEYRVVPLTEYSIPEIRAGIERILSQTALPRTRRNKPYDLRPLIESLTFDVETEPPAILMQLAAREGATGRVEEVLDELGIRFEQARVIRTKINFAADEKAATPVTEPYEE
ncbi:MAG TPA: TIGR03936 family radical SAM-associated protein [Anaerolineaceae bacterium]|nr:TIGR03936 family radical SAM-associated protein [Anaerolineaceae bacterium]